MTSILAMRISSCDVTFRQCPWEMGLNEKKELDRGRVSGFICMVKSAWSCLGLGIVVTGSAILSPYPYAQVGSPLIL